MHLTKLSLVNFKNYSEAGLEFCTGVNCFTGANGEGKTNLLDAVYYLSFCKSFFNPIDSQNIRHGEPFFVLQGTYDIEGKKEELYCGIKKGQKKQFKRNKKEYQRLADHIGLFPLVMISPSDIELIYEGSEIRRKFMDGVICQYNKDYLRHLMAYGKVLSHRNALLKQFAMNRSFDPITLEILDDQLIEHGQIIHDIRKEFIEKFVPIFQSYYSSISGDKEAVSLEYNSKLSEIDFRSLLKTQLEKDRAVQHSTAGIHKDDLVFKLGDHRLKKIGSQGQQKSFLVALKLAQFDFIRDEKDMLPLLLLDDVFDKLDSGRVKAIMALVSHGHFGQIFITDTSRDRVERVFEEIETEYKVFEINEGAVAEEELVQP